MAGEPTLELGQGSSQAAGARMLLLYLAGLVLLIGFFVYRYAQAAEPAAEPEELKKPKKEKKKRGGMGRMGRGGNEVREGAGWDWCALSVWAARSEQPEGEEEEENETANLTKKEQRKREKAEAKEQARMVPGDGRLRASWVCRSVRKRTNRSETSSQCAMPSTRSVRGSGRRWRLSWWHGAGRSSERRAAGEGGAGSGVRAAEAGAGGA